LRKYVPLFEDVEFPSEFTEDEKTVEDPLEWLYSRMIDLIWFKNKWKLEFFRSEGGYIKVTRDFQHGEEARAVVYRDSDGYGIYTNYATMAHESRSDYVAMDTDDKIIKYIDDFLATAEMPEELTNEND